VLWNLAGKRSTVLGGQKPTGGTPSSIGGIVGVNVAFTPDGRLVSTWEKGVRVWPLPGTDEDVRDVRLPSTAWPFEYLTVGARWRFGAVTERVAGRVITFPLDGSPPAVHALEQAYPRSAIIIASMALDPEGRRAALACLEFGKPRTESLHVLDLSTG